MKHGKAKIASSLDRSSIAWANLFTHGVCAMLLSVSGMLAQAQQKADTPLSRIEGLKATLAARGYTSFTPTQLEALKIIATSQPRALLTQNQLKALEAFEDDDGIMQRVCTPAEMANITAPATTSNYRVVINCTPNFTTPVAIKKQVVFEGDQSAFLTLDCKGGTITKPTIPSSDPDRPDSVVIRSIQSSSGKWLVPDGVAIINCNIRGGGVRIYGLGRNGESEKVKASSLTKNHTMTARLSAPYNTYLENVSIVSPSAINLYAGPGVVNLRLQNSKLENQNVNPVIYLDTESIGALIRNNELSVANPNREFLAVDGSEYNQITENTFKNPVKGGIFVYRNCGEGGTIRHTTPTGNEIADNRFVYTNTSQRHGIWLGSRGGKEGYCGEDYYNGQYASLLPYSSSPTKRNGDFAHFNIIKNNVFVNWSSSSSYQIVSETPPSGSLYTGKNGYDVNAQYNTITGNVKQ